jgi:anti-sigma B factor antagonist
VTAGFTSTIEEVAGLPVVRMTGDITRTAADDLNDSFRRACGTGAASVAFDFSSVDYLNSTGIALVVGLLRSARQAGVSVIAWGLSEHFREIFEITRIVEYMTLFDNETAAVAASETGR